MNAREIQKAVERKLITINPMFETVGKIPSKILFDFANMAQRQIVSGLFQIEGSGEVVGNSKSKAFDTLKSFIKRSLILMNQAYGYNDTVFIADKPIDYLYYINSNSLVATSYHGAASNSVEQRDILPKLINVVGDNDTVSKLTTGEENHPIISKPIVMFRNNRFEILYDIYTIPEQLELFYIKQPHRFDVINPSGIPFEGDMPDLPAEYHDELVDATVNLILADGVLKLSQPSQPQSKSSKE